MPYIDPNLNCVSFVWTIQNFSFQFRSNLFSPVLSSKSLSDTKWQLICRPSCYDNFNYRGKNYISLEIKRCDTKDLDIFLDCELCILDDNNSPIIKSMKTKNLEFSTKTRYWSMKKFASEDDVFQQPTAMGTLVIRFQLWRSYGIETQAELCCMNTNLGTCQFQFKINELYYLKENERKIMHLKNAVSISPIVTLEFCKRAPLEHGKFRIGIDIISKINLPFRLLCNVSRINYATWEKFYSVWEEHCFEFTGNNNKVASKKVSMCIDETILMSGNSYSLPKNVELLQVSCLFMPLDRDNDIVFQNLYVCEPSCNKQTMTEDLPRPKRIKMDKESMTEGSGNTGENKTCNEDLNYHRYYQDMQCMYEEGCFSDFTLRSGSKTFQVHKNILSARSPVFKKMLTSTLKDNAVLDIPDVDEDTLQRLLLFLYSNKVEELVWDTAMNLYFAAARYEIDDLKRITRTVLKSKLSASIVCEVISHAHLEKDQDLKVSAVEFIVMHHDQIIGTEDWNKFQKQHTELAVEILNVLYIKMKELIK